MINLERGRNNLLIRRIVNNFFGDLPYLLFEVTTTWACRKKAIITAKKNKDQDPDKITGSATKLVLCLII